MRTISGKETDYDRLNENKKKILLYLLDNKTISRKISVSILKLQKTKTYEVLNAIVEKGLLIRKGKDRSTYYVLGKINKD